MNNIKNYDLNEITLMDDYLVNAYEKEVAYLTKLSSDRLLAGFRDTAGIDMKGAVRYGGWENMLIGGHTLGHYLAACVQAYETANAAPMQREKLLGIMQYMSSSLMECQDAIGTGFIFGAAIRDRANIEIQFDSVEHGETDLITQSWVPWYTMHKIFEGLVAMAGMKAAKGDETVVNQIRDTSKKVASRLADWVYTRTSSWSEETHKTVLSIEFGGMNDCMYDVYLLTGKKEHLEAAKAFDQESLYERIYAAKPGDNALTNHHANTTIPKFMGALKRFTVTGEQKYFDYALAFWNLVVTQHTYITGGNSQWEHFRADRMLDKERTNCNCETCNAYNMLKLTKLLFEITGDGKYADWYENTFINSILSSQNPETGMTTYFQPMQTGYFKVFGEETDKFWCCIGTGMENFSKLGESFYFHKGGDVIVNQYFSSKLDCEDIAFTQKSSIPTGNTVSFMFDREYSGRIMFRLPNWLAGKAEVTVNGVSYDYEVTLANLSGGVPGATGKDACPGIACGALGYAIVSGSFAQGDVIELTLPMKVVAYGLPDSDNAFAFKYGPVVISALLGTESMVTGKTGVDVTIPQDQILSANYLCNGTDILTITSGMSVNDFTASIDEYMKRDETVEGLKFKLTGVSDELTYVTHYRQYKERYGIYMRFATK